MAARDQKMNSIAIHIWDRQENEGLQTKSQNMLKCEIFRIDISVFASVKNLVYLRFLISLVDENSPKIKLTCVCIMWSNVQVRL